MASTTKCVLVFYFLSTLCCLVMADHHRIIIEERAPRSQRGRHNNNKSKHQFNGNRKVPKKTRESEEAVGNYDDEESESLEERFLKKYQDSKQNGPKRQNPHSHPHPLQFSNYEEIKFEPFKSGATQSYSNWTPLNDDPIQQYQKNKKNQQKFKKQLAIPYDENTTRFPIIRLEESTLYPQSLAIFSQGEYLDKPSEVHQNPFISVGQFAKNAYDVHEAETNLRPYILISQDDVSEITSGEKRKRESEEVTTYRPHKSRAKGRHSRRSKKKH